MLLTQINDSDVSLAEAVILPANLQFDEQQIQFIKNFESIDLQAVPGSGKTTALLAKLLVLQKALLLDGAGILVISHTNTAVDEIKDRLGTRCPSLFSYPNFVGTIQSFVDEFLAIPFYSQILHKRPYRIDDQIHEERVFKPGKASGWLRNRPDAEKILKKSRLNHNGELVYGYDEGSAFPLKNKSDTYEALLKMKQVLFQEGVLSFDDAYFMALKALKDFPGLIPLLRRRFPFVFVDEMQDMAKHQYDLLELIFGGSSVVYQRIGDKNQAIFSKAVKAESFWEDKGRKILPIDGSNRFSQEIADVVQCFALNKQSVKGGAKHKSIKPHLLIFESGAQAKVLSTFVNLIEEKQSEGKLSSAISKVIKAIGWRKQADKQGQLGLKDYFPAFESISTGRNVDCTHLTAYVHGNRNILDAFVKALRLQRIKTIEGRFYSRTSLLAFLEESHSGVYEELRRNLFVWSKMLHNNESDFVVTQAREGIIRLFKVVFAVDSLTNETSGFISLLNGDAIGAVPKNHKNVYIENGVEVEVGTIHSIKGETHLATLYLETVYQGEHESQRMEWLLKTLKPPVKKMGAREKETLKMMYVGMSRPSHFLCFAVRQNHVQHYIADIPDALWHKVYIKN